MTNTGSNNKKMSLVRKTINSGKKKKEKERKNCYFDVPFPVSMKQNVLKSSPYFTAVKVMVSLLHLDPLIILNALC